MSYAQHKLIDAIQDAADAWAEEQGEPASSPLYALLDHAKTLTQTQAESLLGLLRVNLFD